jgi:hypothetical protein
MAVNSRRKGRTFQTAVRQWWVEQFGDDWVLEVGGAGAETTDLVVFTPRPHQPNLAVEAKNQKAMDLAGWVDQAVRQAPADAVPVVMHKRRGRSDIGQCYVTLRADDLARLLS